MGVRSWLLFFSRTPRRSSSITCTQKRAYGFGKVWLINRDSILDSCDGSLAMWDTANASRQTNKQRTNKMENMQWNQGPTCSALHSCSSCLRQEEKQADRVVRGAFHFCNYFHLISQ